MRRAEAGIQVDKFYPPTDWLDNNNKQIDIRKNAENNSIVLLVGHNAGFSKYSLLGLLAQVSSGTYDVYIDDVLVGSGVTSNTQYDIDFSQIATTYGTATTPEALVLHKVVVKPTTSGEKISYFRCARTSGVTTQQNQGVVWIHFELDNKISLYLLTNNGSQYYNFILTGVTSKGDIINTSDMESCFRGTKRFSMLPLFKSDSSITLYNSFGQSGINKCKRIRYDTMQDLTGNTDYSCVSAANLEQYYTKKRIRVTSNAMTALYKLKMLPKIYHPTSTNIVLSEMSALYPTKLDFRDISNMLICRTYGTSSYTMRGLRGLKVSNEAPFTGASPHINVSYTGLDRDALVELFQSLPTVTGGQTLSLVGATGNNLTKVGSPTIDENGVASGFSSADYLQIAQNSFGKRAEIVIKFTTSNSFSTTMGLFSHGGDYIYIKTNRRIETQFNYGGSNRWVAGQTTLQNNTTYYLKLVTEYDKGVEMWLSTDGINYVLENSSNYWWGTLSVQYARYGYLGTLSAFNGSIDLNETLIKTDRNYLMKGYITDTDKNIALNKGWSLTLS